MQKRKIYTTAKLFAAAAAMVVSGASHAASTGFTLVISDGGGNAFNAPLFQLTNDSTLATLESFKFTIGDTSKNFDTAQNFAGPASATVVTPDEVNNLERNDLFEIDFLGFDSGETLSWITDVDDDSANTVENVRNVFFNNGAGIANSIATAMFSDGRSVALTLPDGSATANSYTFTAVVPLPAAAWLFGSALMGFMALSNRRRA